MLVKNATPNSARRPHVHGGCKWVCQAGGECSSGARFILGSAQTVRSCRRLQKVRVAQRYEAK